MNLLVLGKGKTGALVAEVAALRGHRTKALGSADNASASALTAEKLAGIDGVIDFTNPQSAVENITACARAGVNMVMGTTGWYPYLDKIRDLVEASGTGFLYGPNFSVGVNVFFEIARAAAAGVPLGYGVKLMERHHAEKKDAPSGTALTIQKIVQQAGGASSGPEIASIREGDTVGTHVIFLDSEHDTMMLVHDAKSRRGFAEGAVRAAEWLKGKKGFYEFKDIFRQLK